MNTIKAWRGARPWQAGVAYDDAWNEEQVADRAILPLFTVVDGVTSAHRRLIHQLDLIDDNALIHVGVAPWDEEMPLIDFFYSMAEHYAEHVRDLKAYQGRCLEGCP
ncbi:MAG: hypothetical protein CVU38_13820 [Chloroflexi bacterium HGW-Chloroflexi-1]|nr:MAG: hypothetical protein CVU38_13820 [Chloroflexi bacterium HGW-Chloroflexi-1]